MDMTRKDFIWLTVVGLGGAAVGCGPDLCKDGAKDTAMSNQHTTPHRLAVPTADFSAPANKEYDIKGDSAHSHLITLTPENFKTLKGGGTVTVDSTAFTNSTGASHIHSVTVGCSATMA
jgi:hypothetical protein